MISRLLLTTWLLHYCSSQDVEQIKRNSVRDSRSARRRDASLRGEARIDASIEDVSRSIDESDSSARFERGELAYDPLRSIDGREIHAALHESADQIEPSSSSIEQTPADRADLNTREVHFPLPHESDADQELTELYAKKLAARALATHPDGLPYRVFHPSTISLSYILSQKALRKECNLVTLELFWESLQQSRETSWMVSLGSLEDLEGKHLPNYIQQGWGDSSGEGTVVEFSHMQYYQPFERHAFCLPGKGIYTFTIFDWGGDGLANTGGNSEFGEGSYTLYSSDGRPLVTGGSFKYMESQEFMLPLPPLDTESPGVSPAPTVSAEPTMDCDWIEINILYDMYPEETTW